MRERFPATAPMHRFSACRSWCATTPTATSTRPTSRGRRVLGGRREPGAHARLPGGHRHRARLHLPGAPRGPGGAGPEGKLAMLGQLAGGVGHELSNPLGVIKNSVYYLNMILPEDEKVQKHLGILDREVATSNRIVTDLLDFARVKSAKRSLIDQLVRAAPRSPARAGDGRGSRELMEGCPRPRGSSSGRADPDQPDHERDSGHAGRGHAHHHGREDRTASCVSVSDTGIGIRPEDLPKIFQPLFTTKAKGIGLGLALARDLAEANRRRSPSRARLGQWAATSRCVSSRASIAWPPQVDARRGRRCGHGRYPRGHSEANGYEVAAAHSGGGGSDGEQGAYDVALMDIQMPGINGVEALKTIRTVGPHLPVIMMTAFTSASWSRKPGEPTRSPSSSSRSISHGSSICATPPGRPAGREPGVTGRGGVLILDDDPGICETLSDVLEERGYHVRVVPPRARGLDISRARPRTRRSWTSCCRTCPASMCCAPSRPRPPPPRSS